MTVHKYMNDWRLVGYKGEANVKSHGCHILLRRKRHSRFQSAPQTHTKECRSERWAEIRRGIAMYATVFTHGDADQPSTSD